MAPRACQLVAEERPARVSASKSEEVTCEKEGERVLVDDVSGWLRVYDDGTVDRSWTGPPQVQFLASPYYPTPESALVQDDIVLKDFTVPFEGGDDLSFRLYLPAAHAAGHKDGGNKNKVPLLLHFHGGGFCISRPTWYMYYQFYSRVALSAGAAVLSVATRQAPEHRLPAAADDGYRALLWLRALANEAAPAAADEDVGESEVALLIRSQADLSRVFLIGDSSGGNLVHEVAARAGGQDDAFWSPLRLAGAVPLHPGFIRATRSRSELEEKQDPFLTLDMLDKFLGYALPVGATKDHPVTCPMGPEAPPMAGLRMPPMLVAVAERDLIRDTNLEYCDAMKAAGKHVEVLLNHGVAHSFQLNKIAVDMDPKVARAAEELVHAIRDFVRRH